MVPNPVVLIVDDSRVSRLMAKQYILARHADWRIEEARTGEEALEMAATLRPNLVVLDVNMPGMGGVAAAEHLRKLLPEAHISLLTANVQDATRVRAEDLGVGFMEKPITAERIARLVAPLENVMKVELTELEHDALVEIFNIGVGQAAASMSAIVSEEVTMSVPSISFLSRAEAAQLLADAHRAGGGSERICGVSQHFDGAFQTEAILMFPEDKSLEIVRLMVGEAVPLQALSEMEQEAMSEIGNIILNSCVGTLANIFQQELTGSLPVYHVGTSDEILSASGQRADTVVLMLHIDFILEKHQIHGYVAFILDVSALHDLKQQINLYLARAMGQH